MQNSPEELVFNKLDCYLKTNAHDCRLEIIFDDFIAIDADTMKTCRKQILRSRRKAAIREANEMLKKTGYSVCSSDMLTAMENAITNAVDCFEASKTQENALALMSLIVCDAMLKNGPLCEEDDD